MGKNIPISGGGYFRLYPYLLTRSLIGWFVKSEKQPYIFYMHPWEVDPAQPRFEQAGFKSRFRHYLNLKRVESRLARMLSEFEWDSLSKAYAIN
jgi:hypothetical protein